MACHVSTKVSEDGKTEEFLHIVKRIVKQLFMLHCNQNKQMSRMKLHYRVIRYHS